MKNFGTLFFFLMTPVLADAPLFSAEEKKNLEWYLSDQYLADKMTEELSKKSELKVKLALKLLAKKDRANKKHFLRPGLWEREEKRENYEAMKRWLQEISPIKNKEE